MTKNISDDKMHHFLINMAKHLTDLAHTFDDLKPGSYLRTYKKLMTACADIFIDEFQKRE